MREYPRSNRPDGIVLGVVLAIFMLAGAALVNDNLRSGPPATVDAGGLEIEHLREGGTLWDMARIYAPTQDPRRWIERVQELNSWTEVPNLQPYESFIVPDWRKWPQNVETRTRPDGSTDLVPIDPYAQTSPPSPLSASGEGESDRKGE